MYMYQVVYCVSYNTLFWSCWSSTVLHGGGRSGGTTSPPPPPPNPHKGALAVEMMRANKVALVVERKRSEDYYGGVRDGVGKRGKGTQLMVERNKDWDERFGAWGPTRLGAEG